MKKILLSLVTIIGIAVMVVGSAKAVFSAQGTIVGNTISSATVTLQVHNLSGNKPIDTSMLFPGQWTPDGRAELYNTGSAPVKVYMYADNIAGAACDKTNLMVSTGYAGGDETLNVLYNGSLQGISGPGNRFETTAGLPFNSSLGANITQVIHQQAQLDSTADNAYQNTSCTWDEVFVAENVTP